MPNVVRFTLPAARTLNIRGAGQFIAGVLDVDANNVSLVARTRYLVKPFGAVEVGIVPAGTAAPSLPAVPVTPPVDPFPQYAADTDLANYVPFNSRVYARTVAGSPPPPPPQLKAIDTFQAGHSWVFQAGTANADPASNLAATAGAPIGSQYVRMVTTGAGGSVPCRLTRPGLSPALDMTARKFAILCRVTNSQNLDNILIYAGSSGFSTFHNFQLDRYEDDRVKSWFREGEWMWMVFGMETLLATTGTPTRSGYVDLRIAVGDKGGGNKVTLDVAALASVPEPTSPVASGGVVSFTCDDGRRSQFTVARPILDKYLFPATAYIIADQIGATSSTLGYEGPMSLADLRQLQDANRWEIAAHSSTAAHHDPPGGFVNLTSTELEAEHLAMKSWLKDNGFRAYEHMAYPQGSYSPSVLASVRASYVSGRSVNGFRTETWPPNDPHRIQAVALSNGITLAAVKARVDRAVQGKGWLVITVHRVDPTGPTDGLTWLTSDFQQLVDYVAASGATVRTIGDVLASR